MQQSCLSCQAWKIISQLRKNSYETTLIHYVTVRADDCICHQMNAIVEGTVPKHENIQRNVSSTITMIKVCDKQHST